MRYEQEKGGRSLKQEISMEHCESLPDVECVSSVFHGYRAVSQKPDVDTDRQTDRKREKRRDPC